jgi:hypothetical protein
MEHVAALIWLEGHAPIAAAYPLRRGGTGAFIRNDWARGVYRVDGSLLIICEDKADAEHLHAFLETVQAEARKAHLAMAPVAGSA